MPIPISTCPMREGGGIPLEVKHLSFHYPNQSLLYRDLSFQIHEKERFLIVGENGAGKSTLLKLIMGIHSPDTGSIHVHPKTDVAYYAQELEQIDLPEFPSALPMPSLLWFLPLLSFPAQPSFMESVILLPGLR